ncbi:hypothetical protein JTB14_016248 [Gonioctena quinquepunctata]|nr:hypothetical protein JTB14_016248 [Gonioctena quinquepunctata]
MYFNFVSINITCCLLPSRSLHFFWVGTDCEKKLDGFDNLLRDKNHTYAVLRPVELSVASTFRNDISGYPIRETDMVDKDPEDVKTPGVDNIPEDLDSEDSIKDLVFEI